jgi:hypothetical protein
MAVASTSIRFAAPSSPTICAPSSRPGPLLRDHLDRDRPGAREVAGAGGRLGQRRDVAQPGPLRLGLAQPGPGHLEAAHPGDRGADHPGERRVPAADVDARHPALLVGVRAERDVHRLRGDPVDRLHAVTGGPDVAVRRGAHPHVGDDPAGHADLDAGVAGQRRVGPHAEPEHDHVRRDLPLGGEHADRLAAGAGADLGDLLAAVQGDAERADASATSAPTSGSSVDIGCGAASTTVTSSPRWTNASAISSPM